MILIMSNSPIVHTLRRWSGVSGIFLCTCVYIQYAVEWANGWFLFKLQEPVWKSNVSSCTIHSPKYAHCSRFHKTLSQTPCTALTAGICLPLVLCKGTVSDLLVIKRSRFLSTDSPTTTRPGLCNSLSSCLRPHWQSYSHQARAV